MVLRSLALWILVSATVAAFLVLRTNLDIAVAIPVSILAGQLAAVAQVGLGVTTNPLNYKYLKNYIANPYKFGPTRVDGEPHPIALELAEAWRLDLNFTVQDQSADPPPVFDLLQSPSKVVTVSVSRASGVVSFLSLTEDGRIVHTDNFLVLPHEQLIVNTVKGDAQALASSHVQLVDGLAKRGLKCVPTPPRIFLDAMKLEQETYGDVGPFLGSFLNIEDAAAPHRMAISLKREELLELALSDLPTEPVAAPESAAV